MTTMMMVMLKIPWLGLSCGVELWLLQVQAAGTLPTSPRKRTLLSRPNSPGMHTVLRISLVSLALEPAATDDDDGDDGDHDSDANTGKTR